MTISNEYMYLPTILCWIGHSFWYNLVSNW